MAHLLVVDDEQTICWGLRKLAEGLGHKVTTAASAEQALVAVRTAKPDAVVLDVRLPGMDGLTAMKHIKEEAGNIPIIVITAYGDLDTAVEAVRNGAFEYLVKPFELKVAQRVVMRALAAPPPKVAIEKAEPEAQALEAGELVGKTAAMQEVFKRIALVAASDACVHLRGESGTGKELVARAIHRYSRRSQGNFVAVNIAALSPTLAESELFGHVRGAFTGADQPRKGLLEAADGGTIFLDEVADIPLPLQVKLLRSLEHGEVLPVGADHPIQSDFRVISATHQNLVERVAAGSFRHDLYFRLSTFEIVIPPLRERREDIVDLSKHFLTLSARKTGGARPVLSREALSELEKRPWYGNVRELRNAIEHAIILARGGTMLPEHLPPAAAASLPAGGSQTGDSQIARLLREWAVAQLQAGDELSDLYERMLKLVEPPILEAALNKHRGQCAAAARSLGLHRMTLRKKLDQFGIAES